MLYSIGIYITACVLYVALHMILSKLMLFISGEEEEEIDPEDLSLDSDVLKGLFFHLFYVAGALWFVVFSGYIQGNILHLLLGSVFFCLVVYTVYYLSNLYLIKDEGFLNSLLQTFITAVVTCGFCISAYYLSVLAF